MQGDIPEIVELDGSNLADGTRSLLVAFEAFLSVDWTEADPEIHRATREVLLKATQDAIAIWKLVHAVPITEKAKRVN